MTHVLNENNGDQFPGLGAVYRNCSGGSYVNQLSRKNVVNTNGVSAQSGNILSKGWGPQSSTPSAWGCPNLTQKLGLHCNGNAGTTQNADFKNLSSSGNELSSQQNRCIDQGWKVTVPQVDSAMLSNGEHMKEKDEYLSSSQVGVVYDDAKTSSVSNNDDYDNDDDQVLFGSSDDDDFFDDDLDDDTNEKDHHICGRRKWFKSFFDDLDKLNGEELTSQARKWHCPACKGGPGAIDWYRGLEPLMYHAMTRKTRRARVHRVFAELLDEETQKKGVSVAPVGVAFGRWKGLNEKVTDYEIVWPPMVIIMNTRYEQEENSKWIGMGNQELLDHFKSYAALKARHSYGPQGHRGISVLIFDDSTAGYLEAARLHKHFREHGRDREAWKRNRFPFCFEGGKRQLYGYMALKEDLDFFNQHSQGRSRLKFEMRSYQETVERQIKQINENNQQLVKCKDKIAKEQKHSQILAESVSRLSMELRRTTERNHNIRQQTKFLLEEQREEMNSQEQFFMDQIKFIHQVTDTKEDKTEKLQQAIEEETIVQPNLSAVKDTHRMVDIVPIINQEDNRKDDFETERKRLITSHEDKKALVIKRCWEELLRLEKEYEKELTKLVEKYNSDHPEVKEVSNC